MKYYLKTEETFFYDGHGTPDDGGIVESEEVLEADCSLNKESLDRWYVFCGFGSDFDFQAGTSYTREECEQKIKGLLSEVNEHSDPEYHERWLKEALKHLKDEDNVFYPDYMDEYYDDDED